MNRYEMIFTLKNYSILIGLVGNNKTIKLTRLFLDQLLNMFSPLPSVCRGCACEIIMPHQFGRYRYFMLEEF